MTQISERTLNPPRRRPRQSLPPLSSFPLPCGTLLSQWKWERPRHGLGHYLPFIAALQVGCRMLSLSQSVEGERQDRDKRKMPNEKNLNFQDESRRMLANFFRHLSARCSRSFILSRGKRAFSSFHPQSEDARWNIFISQRRERGGGWLDIVMEGGERERNGARKNKWRLSLVRGRDRGRAAPRGGFVFLAFFPSFLPFRGRGEIQYP